MGKPADEDLHADAFYASAEGWAERERERQLIALMVEAAQLKSAARERGERKPRSQPAEGPPAADQR
jgi:hypothetical protein